MNNVQIRIYRVTSKKTGFTTTQAAVDGFAAANKAINECKFSGHSVSDLITKLVFVNKIK